MSRKKYFIKNKGKVLVYILLVMSSLLPCLASPLKPTAITILQVEKPVYTATQEKGLPLEVCKNWLLSDEDIINLFTNSDRFNDEAEILRSYYWLPCEISGRLISDNKHWHFTINAAATAKWTDGPNTIYFGCSKIMCARLFLLPYDGLSGQ